MQCDPYHPNIFTYCTAVSTQLDVRNLHTPISAIFVADSDKTGTKLYMKERWSVPPNKRYYFPMTTYDTYGWMEPFPSSMEPFHGRTSVSYPVHIERIQSEIICDCLRSAEYARRNMAQKRTGHVRCGQTVADEKISILI